MRINNNISAQNTHRYYTTNNEKQSDSLEKLSSGQRINKAADDAAGLAISEKMRGQIRGLEQAERNSQDGISMIQTAEGALNETHSILQRTRELSVQASNDTYTDTDRQEIQKEIDQLTQEIDRIANDTEFNSKKVLNGDLSGTEVELGSVSFDNQGDSAVFTGVVATTASVLGTPGTEGDETLNVEISDYDAALNQYTITWTTQSGETGTVAGIAAAGGTSTIATAGGSYDLTLGALTTDDLGKQSTFTSRKSIENYTDNSVNMHIGSNASQTMSIGIGDMSASALHIDNLDVTSAASAEASIAAIDHAMESVSAERSKLGAYQNRLDHTINNLRTSSENLTAAESRIRDVDMAKEYTEYTKWNVLTQSSTSMLAQANQQTQSVLQLIQ